MVDHLPSTCEALSLITTPLSLHLFSEVNSYVIFRISLFRRQLCTRCSNATPYLVCGLIRVDSVNVEWHDHYYHLNSAHLHHHKKKTCTSHQLHHLPTHLPSVSVTSLFWTLELMGLWRVALCRFPHFYSSLIFLLLNSIPLYTGVIPLCIWVVSTFWLWLMILRTSMYNLYVLLGTMHVVWKKMFPKGAIMRCGCVGESVTVEVSFEGASKLKLLPVR